LLCVFLLIILIHAQASEDLTEDTLYEISTCWQDALSSNDIQLTDDLLEICSDTLNKKLATPIDLQTPIENVEILADLTAKLILCSTESATNDADKLKSIDKIIDHVLNQRSKVYKEQATQLTNLASYIEVLNGSLAVKTLDDDSNVSKATLDATLEEYFSLSLFKLSVIFKLSCNIKKREKRQKISTNSEDDDNDEIGGQASQDMEEDEEEYTEDFCNMDENLLKVWSDEIYDQMLECFYATALSDTVLYNTSQLNENFESLFLSLQEKLTLLIKNISENLFAPLKTKLFVCANKTGLIWSKSLIYLLNLDQYSDSETGAVLLYEDSSTNYMDEANMIGYINILQVSTQVFGVDFEV
jgi:E3 ubiquitin-protein ligase listerin